MQLVIDGNSQILVCRNLLNNLISDFYRHTSSVLVPETNYHFLGLISSRDQKRLPGIYIFNKLRVLFVTLLLLNLFTVYGRHHERETTDLA